MATTTESGVQTEIAFLTQALEHGMRVLDAGCGSGNVLDAAARAVGGPGAVVGLDVSPESLALCRRRSALNRNCGVEWADLSKGIPWNDESFDAILCHRLLEELPDPAAFISDAVRVLRPGGVLLAVIGEVAAIGHQYAEWLEGFVEIVRQRGLTLEHRGPLEAESASRRNVTGLRARKQRNGTA